MVAALVALLVVLGAALALIGSVGLLRLKTFYERVHPPTMGTTLGVGFTVAASILLSSAIESRRGAASDPHRRVLDRDDAGDLHAAGESGRPS